MNKLEAKTPISMRFPSALLEKVDEEAKARKRSRAFVIIEKVEFGYTGNGTKPKGKPREAD